MPERVRVRAPAKINLTLRVTGVRADGYHELRTVFQSIALHDTLTCERRPGPFAIACDDPACPVDERNLVWRAAARVWEAGGRRGAMRDAAVRIRKRIPMEAGLGGGSSDAAAALRAFAALWRVRLTPDEMRALAAGLGADVPYFLEGGTALGLNRGDLLFPLADLRPHWVVIVVPPFGVSTKDAFEWWDASAAPRSPRRAGDVRKQAGTGQGRGRKPEAEAPRSLLELPESELVNDLQGPVAARHPAIARLVRRLDRAGAEYAAMSGSGSAVFGLFRSRGGAAAAAAAVSARKHAVFLTRTRSRAQCQAGW